LLESIATDKLEKDWDKAPEVGIETIAEALPRLANSLHGSQFAQERPARAQNDSSPSARAEHTTANLESTLDRFVTAAKESGRAFPNSERDNVGILIRGVGFGGGGVGGTGFEKAGAELAMPRGTQSVSSSFYGNPSFHDGVDMSGGPGRLLFFDDHAEQSVMLNFDADNGSPINVNGIPEIRDYELLVYTGPNAVQDSDIPELAQQWITDYPPPGPSPHPMAPKPQYKIEKLLTPDGGDVRIWELGTKDQYDTLLIADGQWHDGAPLGYHVEGIKLSQELNDIAVTISTRVLDGVGAFVIGAHTLPTLLTVGPVLKSFTAQTLDPFFVSEGANDPTEENEAILDTPSTNSTYGMIAKAAFTLTGYATHANLGFVQFVLEVPDHGNELENRTSSGEKIAVQYNGTAPAEGIQIYLNSDGISGHPQQDYPFVDAHAPWAITGNFHYPALVSGQIIGIPQDPRLQWWYTRDYPGIYERGGEGTTWFEAAFRDSFKMYAVAISIKGPPTRYVTLPLAYILWEVYYSASGYQEGEGCTSHGFLQHPNYSEAQQMVRTSAYAPGEYMRRAFANEALKIRDVP
jgi:hypothetical protein